MGVVGDAGDVGAVGDVGDVGAVGVVGDVGAVEDVGGGVWGVHKDPRGCMGRLLASSSSPDGGRFNQGEDWVDADVSSFSVLTEC